MSKVFDRLRALNDIPSEICNISLDDEHWVSI